jgi:L-2-hydroxyglutarate oxidase LhgO
VELIDEKQLKEIEPNAKTCGMALYSYYTAVVEPKTVLKNIHADLIATKKVTILNNTQFKRLKGSKTALTNKGEINFGKFINAAGAYSDKVAHSFDVGLNYRLIPFKGIYKRLKKEKSHLVNGNIYPVPDIRNPFLGVHFTKSVEGDVYLGPTAIPAFGRENYGIIQGMDREAIDILTREVVLFFLNSQFRRVVLSEPKKYFKKYFFEDVKELVKKLEPDDIIPSDKVGIRPQLIDWEKRKIVMDFAIIKNGDSTHILNAISPAFTSSMDFAEFVVKQYIN